MHHYFAVEGHDVADACLPQSFRLDWDPGCGNRFGFGNGHRFLAGVVRK
jgi:hypothetical protein